MTSPDEVQHLLSGRRQREAEHQRREHHTQHLDEEEPHLVLEEPAELVPHLEGSRSLQPVVRIVVRVCTDLLQQHLGRLAASGPARGFVREERDGARIDRGEDAEEPEQIVLAKVDVEKRVLAEETDEEESGHEGAADVGETARHYCQVGVVEGLHVGFRGLDGLLDASGEYMRQLVVLAELPKGEGTPLPRTEVALAAVEALRVLQEEVHGHEDQHEWQQNQVNEAHQLKLPLETLRRGGR